MVDDPTRNHRRSLRLQGYGYSQEGAYFVTLLTYQRECIFGEIGTNDAMLLGKFGQIVQEEWLRTPSVRSYAQLDEFVVMPNHFHGILVLTDHSSTSKGTQTRVTGCNPGSIQAGDHVTHPHPA
jgi:REP element-mobilizing transposase RayT